MGLDSDGARSDGVRIRPLGGIGHFGANAMLIEDVPTQTAIVVDCGVRLLVDEPYGFDFALPDLEPLKTYPGTVLGYLLTHAHEDHIGALPFAHGHRPAKFYATSFSARMIERRFARLDSPSPVIHEVSYGESYSLGPFEAEWIAVSHSIPQAAALAIRTRVGVILHSGDFRVDSDPVIGLPTDLDRLSTYGDAGVYCLLSDSTGADLPGKNRGEKSVVTPLHDAMQDASGRVLVATFSSHVSRLKVLQDLAEKLGRRPCVLGRGMRNVAELAQRQGILSDAWVVDEGRITEVARRDQLIAVTGSQGEPGSALSRLAQSRHPHLELETGDRVIISARVIPGNELAAAHIEEQLVSQGIEVIDGRQGRHVSGHGFQEDLEMLLAATRPRFFVALHGTPGKLRHHRELARGMGVAVERILPVESGDTLHFLENGGARISPGAPKEAIARGLYVVENPEPVLQVRRRMATGGTLVLWRVENRWHAHGRALDPGLSSDVLDEITHALDRDDVVTSTPTQRVARLCSRRGLRSPEVIVLDDLTTSPS